VGRRAADTRDNNSKESETMRIYLLKNTNMIRMKTGRALAYTMKQWTSSICQKKTPYELAKSKNFEKTLGVEGEEGGGRKRRGQ